MALIGRVPTEESVIGDWEHKTSAAPLERVCQKLTIVKPARYYLISVGFDITCQLAALPSVAICRAVISHLARMHLGAGQRKNAITPLRPGLKRSQVVRKAAS